MPATATITETFLTKDGFNNNDTEPNSQYIGLTRRSNISRKSGSTCSKHLMPPFQALYILHL
jgi:hypothetical protein